MAAKKKSNPNPVNNSNSGYSLADFKNPVKTKPTEAITVKGQKATGLAKPTVQDRFASTAKTPVYKAQQGLRGTGTPLNVSLNYEPTKGNIVNAALTVTGVKGSGVIAQKIGQTVGKYVGSKSLPILSEGLQKSGAGGKLYGALTPEGRALASTAIGTSKQQAARMGNLSKNALNRSEQIAASVAKDVVRGVNTAGRVAGVVAAKAANKPTKPKKK